jgi:hypothetical protein
MPAAFHTEKRSTTNQTGIENPIAGIFPVIQSTKMDCEE